MKSRKLSTALPLYHPDIPRLRDDFHPMRLPYLQYNVRAVRLEIVRQSSLLELCFDMQLIRFAGFHAKLPLKLGIPKENKPGNG
jgi:hypothetical protein